MEEKDHHQDQTSHREIDPFSRLMFGQRKPKETHTESDNHQQEIPEQNEKTSFHTRANYRNDWLFGRRRQEPVSDHKNKPQQTKSAPNQLENLINNVDIGLLMETIDTFVETTKQYKPIIKEIVPFFSKITKKFKK